MSHPRVTLWRGSAIRTQVENATKEVEALVAQVTGALDGVEQLLGGGNV